MEGTYRCFGSFKQNNDFRPSKSCQGVVVGIFSLLQQVAEDAGEVLYRRILPQLAVRRQPVLGLSVLQ